VKTFIYVCVLVCMAVCAFGLGNNQLYTGDPSTVPPGKTQAQLYTDSTHPSSARLGGVQFRHGLTGNLDAKLAYSYLWNFDGPNVQLGPNVGVKWRFAGDGRRKPSLAISTLYVISQSVGGQPRKNDYAATLIGSYHTRHAELLANFGRVWVGDNVPDLRFTSFALVRPVSKRTIVALEYSSLTRIGAGGPSALGRQVAAGIVYGRPLGWSYGFQAAYLLDNTRTKWHTTLGVSTYF
jgi:hypothetical protein